MTTSNPAQPPAFDPSTASPIMKFFGFSHLPVGALRETSQMFGELALRIDALQPTSQAGKAEKATALRKLLEAKDAAVRSVLP